MVSLEETGAIPNFIHLHTFNPWEMIFEKEPIVYS